MDKGEFVTHLNNGWCVVCKNNKRPTYGDPQARAEFSVYIYDALGDIRRTFSTSIAPQTDEAFQFHQEQVMGRVYRLISELGYGLT